MIRTRIDAELHMKEQLVILQTTSNCPPDVSYPSQRPAFVLLKMECLLLSRENAPLAAFPNAGKCRDMESYDSN